VQLNTPSVTLGLMPTQNARSPAKRGRPADASSKSGQVRELLKTGMSAADIAQKVGCTVSLVYNVKSTSGQPARRGPGRPRKVPTSASLNGIAEIVAAVQGGERERSRLRAALERVRAVIAEVLG